mmetsp:Transcript_28101/g.58383  ORF Transcript_28101/g.58383 Transcript_28101/m.58383 type:complete len:248 (+) Transcript_28101:164-907(+)
MAVANHLKRSSSCEDVVCTCEQDVHNNKKAREQNDESTTTATTTTTLGGRAFVRFSSKNDVFEISRPTKEERNDMHMSSADQNLILREIIDGIRRLDSYHDQQQQQYPHEGIGCDFAMDWDYGSSNSRSSSNNNNNTESNNTCIEDLGLERILEQQDADRIKRMRSAIFVILQRQKQSRRLLRGNRNPFSRGNGETPKQQPSSISEHWLEKHYRPYSKVSAKLARNRALRDQELAPSLFPRKMVMAR